MTSDESKPLDGSYRPRSRKRCCCMTTTALLGLLVIILVVAISIPLARRKGHHVAQENGVTQAIQSACSVTLYPEICKGTISSNPSSQNADSKGLTSLAVSSASQAVNETRTTVLALNGSNANVTAAVEVCMENLQNSLDQLSAASSQISSFNLTALRSLFQDLKTQISAAMEFHTTCIDVFSEIAPADGQLVADQGNKTAQILSISLSFVNALADFGNDLSSWKSSFFHLGRKPNLSDLHIPGLHRRLLSSPVPVPESLGVEDPFPSWLNPRDRRLLVARNNVQANVVVAKDSSGTYTTIQKAVDNAPLSSSSRYVIYIKAGTYSENVTIPKAAKNLMLLGDGINKTIITAANNVQMQGMTTFKSATVAVNGPGFIAQGITIQNTAGAIKHQAVALRVSADQTAFYLCSFEGYQDTLYTHTFRQFYRNCTIYGTVDFIFGNAAVSFQSCTILAKTGLAGQQNTYTAQGRTDPGQNTGTSFQNCVFDGTSTLQAQQAQFPTYLGRPWKLYSLCVHLKSNLGAVVNSAGWLAWSGDFALSTLYYAEYKSTGAGASTKGRVSWSTQITNTTEASKYQATKFIDANSWLPETNIEYTTTL